MDHDGAVSDRRRSGMRGFACLGLIAAAGWLGGLGLIVAGIGVYARAASRTVERLDDAHELTRALEQAVVLCGFAALALLVGIVASVVLVKELGDDVDRAGRGPVSPG